MLATILITNYNYGAYLPAAIDSALRQSHPDVEVVVVDDGSTDGSRAIIEGYRGRITAVLKENEGQAAAINLGFERSRGEVVCLLDSDDFFESDKVHRVVTAFRDGVSVVYHQLQATDAENRPLGKPAPRSALRGDIRSRVERAGGWWPHPLTSGLSFSRTYLERVLPIPVLPERLFADTYLAGPAPFLGAVVGIPEALGYNRLHGRNTWTLSNVAASRDQEVLRQRSDRYEFEFRILVDTLQRLGVRADLSPEDNPVIQRDRWGAGDGVSMQRALLTSLRCPTLPWPMKWRDVARLVLRRY